MEVLKAAGAAELNHSLFKVNKVIQLDLDFQLDPFT